MARDPRKNSAFDSGMRGREKPKIANAHGGTMVNDNGGTDPLSTHKQEPGKTIGMPGGVTQNDPVYSSGMRGMEKAKQKSASGTATYGQKKDSAGGGESKQGPNTRVGEPDGEDTAGMGARKGITDASMQTAGAGAKKLGIAGDNTEMAGSPAAPEGQAGILGEEDDTHINLRIPKASLKKKMPGLQTS